MRMFFAPACLIMWIWDGMGRVTVVIDGELVSCSPGQINPLAIWHGSVGQILLLSQHLGIFTMV